MTGSDMSYANQVNISKGNLLFMPSSHQELEVKKRNQSDQASQNDYRQEVNKLTARDSKT